MKAKKKRRSNRVASDDGLDDRFATALKLAAFLLSGFCLAVFIYHYETVLHGPSVITGLLIGVNSILAAGLMTPNEKLERRAAFARPPPSAC